MGAGSPLAGQSLSLGFPRQEYWSALPFPSPDPGVEPKSPTLAGGFFSTEPPGTPWPYNKGVRHFVTWGLLFQRGLWSALAQ